MNLTEVPHKALLTRSYQKTAPDGVVGEFHQPETHLISLLLDVIYGKRDALTIFGMNYDTPDGTCIRGLGLKWLQSGLGSRVFNLGTGDGFRCVK